MQQWSIFSAFEFHVKCCYSEHCVCMCQRGFFAGFVWGVSVCVNNTLPEMCGLKCVCARCDVNLSFFVSFWRETGNRSEEDLESALTCFLITAESSVWFLKLHTDCITISVVSQTWYCSTTILRLETFGRRFLTPCVSLCAHNICICDCFALTVVQWNAPLESYSTPATSEGLRPGSTKSIVKYNQKQERERVRWNGLLRNGAVERNKKKGQLIRK